MRTVLRWVRKWWPGLIPLGLLWIWAAWANTIAWETDLAGRAAAALKGNVLDQAKVEAAGRDLKFSAAAFSEEGRQAALAIVEAVPGTRLVDDDTHLIAEAKPFVWTGERDVTRFALGGGVPTPAIRGRLDDAMKGLAGGAEIVDRMEYKRGAPPRFDAAAQLLIEQLARLGNGGKVSLSDSAISLKGTARDLGGREAIADALKKLPEGFSITENAIQAPPYIFQANKDPVAATVTLSGYVPDNNIHSMIVAAAKRKFFNEQILDNLKASVGSPPGFTQGVIEALGGLSRLSTGVLTVSDNDIKLTGDAFYDLAIEQISSELSANLPQGWKADPVITVRPPASSVDSTVCQQLFAELLAKSKIRFESAKSTIDRDSAGLLDRMIETALRCPGAEIEVGGHTDAAGDADANMALSQRRAQAVVDYMVRDGVPADRLKAVGYGASEPLASNDTDEGKAQNRRIEFLVR
jgi:OOP family OmpA-OmpF porin